MSSSSSSSSSSSFNNLAAYAANCALIGLPIPVILTFWGISLKRIHPETVSPPLRLALVFLRIAPPIYAVALILLIVNPAVLAALFTEPGTSNSVYDTDPLYRAYDASRFVSVTGYFCSLAANILIMMVLYLSTIGSFYVVQGRMVWWKLFRVDAPVGGALLMVIAIAWYGRRMTLLANPDMERRADRWIEWLLFIVDMTLALLAAGCLGTMVYVLSKLARRGFEGMKVAMGKAPTLLLVASILWLVRSCYGTADTIKIIREEYMYSDDEARAWLFIYPILQHWLTTAVVGLLVFAVRKSVWSDASIQPTTLNPVIGVSDQQQHQPQPAVYYPAPGQQVPPMMAQQQYTAQQPYPMAPPQGAVPVQYMYPAPGQPQPVYYTNPPQQPAQPEVK